MAELTYFQAFVAVCFFRWVFMAGPRGAPHDRAEKYLERKKSGLIWNKDFLTASTQYLSCTVAVYFLYAWAFQWLWNGVVAGGC